MRISLLKSSILLFLITEYLLATSNFFDYLNEAYKLYREGKFFEAIAQLESAIKLNPESKEVYFALGKIHMKLGNYSKAKYYWDIGFKLQKKEALNIRIKKEGLKNLFQPVDFQTLKEVDERIRKASIHYENALLFIKDGDWRQAEIELKKAINLHPKSTYIKKLIAVLKDQDNFEEARYYEKLLSLRKTPKVSRVKYKYYVMDVNGNFVRINIGKKDGLNLNDIFRRKFKIYTLIPIVDKFSGKTLGFEKKFKGEILLTNIYNEFSNGVIIKGKVYPGDLVEVK